LQIGSRHAVIHKTRSKSFVLLDYLSKFAPSLTSLSSITVHMLGLQEEGNAWMLTLMWSTMMMSSYLARKSYSCVQPQARHITSRFGTWFLQAVHIRIQMLLHTVVYASTHPHAMNLDVRNPPMKMIPHKRTDAPAL